MLSTSGLYKPITTHGPPPQKPNQNKLGQDKLGLKQISHGQNMTDPHSFWHTPM